MSDTNELDDMLGAIFSMQDGLQRRLGYDPQKMNTAQAIEYISWNNHAANGELAEMMQEVGWKPWASSRHINRKEFVEEGIDVFKFLLNQLLAVGVTPAEFFHAFAAKTVVNHDRADNGYTGRKAS